MAYSMIQNARKEHARRLAVARIFSRERAQRRAIARRDRAIKARRNAQARKSAGSLTREEIALQLTMAAGLRVWRIN